MRIEKSDTIRDEWKTHNSLLYWYWNCAGSVMVRKKLSLSWTSHYIWSTESAPSWLHLGSIIPMKRGLTPIALGSRTRRFLTAKPFSWTTAGIDSDTLDSEIRCWNVQVDSTFRRNVIRLLLMCKRCLDFEYSILSNRNTSHGVNTWFMILSFISLYTIKLNLNEHLFKNILLQTPEIVRDLRKRDWIYILIYL